MATYVDPLVLWRAHTNNPTQSGHLFADSLDELMKFAIALGLHPDMIQVGGKGHEVMHFEIEEPVWREAIRAGAKLIEYKAAVRVWKTAAARPCHAEEVAEARRIIAMRQQKG